MAKSAGDAKSIIEHFINIDYQIISGRRPLVFHEDSFDLSIYERFFKAPLVAGALIKGVAAGAPAPATSSSLSPSRIGYPSCSSRMWRAINFL